MSGKGCEFIDIGSGGSWNDGFRRGEGRNSRELSPGVIAYVCWCCCLQQCSGTDLLLYSFWLRKLGTQLLEPSVYDSDDRIGGSIV